MTKKLLIAPLVGAVLLFTAFVAYSQVEGPDPSVNTSCGVSGVNNTGTCLNTVGSSAVSTGTNSGGHGDLFLEDGSSFLLLEDGASKLCLESGC